MSDHAISRPAGHLVAFIAVLASACEPLVIRVTTTDDAVAGSLRRAIDQANASDASDVRVELSPGIYRLTACAASEEDDNQTGDLDLRLARPITLAATGPGVIIEQTCAGERVVHGVGSAALKLSGITLTGGRSATSGGGLKVAGDAELTSCQVLDNDAYTAGGGILAGGAVILRASEVRRNGVFGVPRLLPGTNIWVPDPAFGGGVHARSVTATDTTIAHNHLGSCSGFPVQGASEGGGIFTEQATLTNVTITDHSTVTFCSSSGNNGMAVRARTLQLEHVTIADNAGGAALYVERLVAPHSVVTAPVGHAACAATPRSSDASYSWFGDPSCALVGVGNAQENAAFSLGVLSDNGGPVLTRKPAAGSVLIDRIPTCTVSADARGVPRPQGPACDIGAVEVE